MKIQDSNISMGARHYQAESRSIKESLRVWTGRDNNPQNTAPNPSPPSTGVLTAPSSPPPQASKAKSARDSEEDYLRDNPEARLIKSLVEHFLGRKFKFLPVVPQPDTQQSATAPKALQEVNAAQEWGVEYNYQEQRMESESVAFQTKGIVKTADGQEFQFELQFQLERSYLEENSFSFSAGSVPIDPLVVNFDGPAAQLSADRFSFDLNSDGKDESLAQLKAGSAFLVLDRNDDGKINNGRELFGPSTGQGLSELATLDSDHNDWIDENDEAYSKLRLWNPDGKGDGTMKTLAEANVGAIYLKGTQTPFDLKDESNNTLGEILDTSIYLNPDTGPGTIQQINLMSE